MKDKDDHGKLSVLAARRLSTGRKSLSCNDLFFLEDCLTEELTCAICMDIIDSPMLTACGHVFCVTCINMSLRELCHCPMCKALLTFDMIYPCYPLKSIADQIRKVRISRQAMLNAAAHIEDSKVNMLTKKGEEDRNNKTTLDALDINDGSNYSARRRRSSIGQDIILAMTFMTVISGSSDLIDYNRKQRKYHADTDSIDSWTRCLNMMYKLKDALVETYIVDKTKLADSNPIPLKNLALALQKVVKYDDVVELFSWKQSDRVNDEPSKIVTSLAYSEINELCALSSVTRKINVFQSERINNQRYELIVKYELLTKYKPSCIRWHSSDRNVLIFSDYGGCVQIVDINRKEESIISSIKAHRDKCWAIDVHPWFPKLVATASQDRTVKILDSDYCRTAMKITLPCAVSSCGFCPSSSNKLVTVGLSDHAALTFDLRNIKKPCAKPVMHDGPLAYSMFLNNDDILTGSAACELKISSMLDGKCKMKMNSHENRRYFVGLCHYNGDYIVSGSENGLIHLYIPELPVPVISKQVTNCATSAICFKTNSDEFYCGDRQGNVRLMQLQSIPKDKSIIDAFKSNLYERNRGLFK